MAKVTNDTLKVIRVSINKWGDDGDTSYFEVKRNGSESWSRSDSRGFVMYVEGCENSNDGPWYISHDAYIKFHEDGTVAHTGTAIKI